MGDLFVTLVSLSVYFGGWLTFAVAGARWDAGQTSRCHGECPTRHRWAAKSDCEHFCRRGCWRPDDAVASRHVLRASAVGLLWPLALPVVVVYLLATRKPLPGDLQRRIDELEREVGIDA